MLTISVIVLFLICIFVIFIQRNKISSIKAENVSISSEAQRYRDESITYKTLLEQEKSHNQNISKIINELEQNILLKFKNISYDITSKNNEAFIHLAKESLSKYTNEAKSQFDLSKEEIKNIVDPIKTSLKSFDEKVHYIEQERISSYEALKEQVNNLLNTGKDLKNETANLAGALKSPNLRGKWGEVQLKRLLEISGMLPYCDFDEQSSFETEDDKKIRPDIIVKLPDNRKIIIDAKTPVMDYIQAVNTNNADLQNTMIKNYIKSINDHINKLSGKKYFESIYPSPEFVIMFLPGESFFSTALQEDPFIIEKAMKQKIIIATPSTLLAMLNTIALSWKQFNITNNLKDVLKIGEKLCKQISDMSVILQKIGKNLKTSVSLYDENIMELENKIIKKADSFIKVISQNNETISVLEKNKQ